MSAPLLKADGLCKSYAGVHAVAEVSFSLVEGTITAMIGPNGSGKSTTVDLVTGFQAADAGMVSLDGRALTGLAPEQIARSGLMRTFQQVRVYDTLAIEENLLTAAQETDGTGWLDALLRSRRFRAADSAARARAAELLDLVGLARMAQAPAGVLSYGQKKLVALAGALMPRPRLVILDEPVAGVNPTRVLEVEAIIRRLHQAGQSFLIIEHNVDFVMRLSQRVIVLDQGRKIADGTPEEVRANEAVLEAYLGTEAEPADA
ncbi:ABC transporter ATP-binding protein [Falsiroseomonas oryzae]|uniref:ABC transporter ATP-binding protein n=1 Tax=Falsiroseomonas oryzae TaxID=2766473 RepID=UPI0022EB5D0F|nr:ABC transporter ATP-binding protein [Roseomonas sp. MO-31]